MRTSNEFSPVRRLTARTPSFPLLCASPLGQVPATRAVWQELSGCLLLSGRVPPRCRLDRFGEGELTAPPHGPPTSTLDVLLDSVYRVRRSSKPRVAAPQPAQHIAPTNICRHSEGLTGCFCFCCVAFRIFLFFLFLASPPGCRSIYPVDPRQRRDVSLGR